MNVNEPFLIVALILVIVIVALFLKGICTPLDVRFDAEAEVEDYTKNHPSSVFAKHGYCAVYPRPSDTILFLDFDGVLHMAENGSLEFIPNVVQLLKSNAHLKVVFSTNWRESMSFNHLVELFPLTLSERFLGYTPLCEEESPHTRYTEIVSWLDIHAKDNDWIAIDDTKSLFPPDCKNFFHVERHDGLNEQNSGKLHWLVARHA